MVAGVRLPPPQQQREEEQQGDLARHQRVQGQRILVVRRRAADVIDLRRAGPDLVRQVGQTPSDGPHIYGSSHA